MQRVKRLTASLMARFDEVVRSIENHDAVVAASLEDLRRSLAQARVRHARIRAERDRLGRRIEELRTDAQTWRERARSSADDEETALECLRRSRRCRDRADRLAEAYDKQVDAERRLERELERLNERYDGLNAKRHTMRGREAAAETARVAGSLEPDEGGAEVEDMLERWEVDITATELAARAPVDTDPLEQRFEEQETTESLRAELEELKSQKEGPSDA